MGKLTRRMRRLLKQRGKGTGKGKSRFQFLETLDDDTYDDIFYGGKGGGRGNRKAHWSKGGGKGRKRNPTGPDGRTMTCTICGSETHFRAKCPNNRENTGGAASSNMAGMTYTGPGPLTGLLTQASEDTNLATFTPYVAPLFSGMAVETGSILESNADRTRIAENES